MHKGFGYGTTILAIANIFIGMNELRQIASHSYWYIIAYAIFLAILVIVSGVTVVVLPKAPPKKKIVDD